MPGQFVKRLPTATASGTFASATRTTRLAAAWDLDVQAPYIAGSDRIDAGWRWRTLYLRSLALEMAAGRRLAYLQIVSRTADGNAFPLGQVLLADGFPYPPDDRRSCALLWYLAGAPEAAVRTAGAEPCKAILAALVEATVQFSYLAGHEGRICLHSSPDGTAEQQRQLLERYERVGLQRTTDAHRAAAPQRWAGRRANRYADVKQAAVPQMTRTLSLDVRERAIERAFVGRLVAKLSTSAKRSASTRVEGIVRALGSGQVDQALESAAPTADEPSSERFEDVREFNFEQWRNRHG